MEFACDLFEALRIRRILEQFKNSVPEHITTYISERKVKTAAEAVTLADDYVLTHSDNNWHSGMQRGGRHCPLMMIENCGL